MTALLPVHRAQLLTYLTLTGCPVGLLINFNVARLMDGVKRVIRHGSDLVAAPAADISTFTEESD